MTRRRLAWITLAVLGALAAIGALWSMFGPDRITLTAAEIQERINRALPREFKSVTVERAAVALADSRVALRVNARAAVLGQTFTAVVSALGVPRYDPDRGEIFFDAQEVKVTDFTIAGGSIAERIDRLGGGLRQRVETAAGDLIAGGLKAYLAARPVYRFKDDLKWVVLKAAVANIATQSDSIAITLSLVKLSTAFAAALAIFFVTVFSIVQLVRHPDWGLTAFDLATTNIGQ